MPGTESLRSSLLMPSCASVFASSAKSELGATSNDSLVQCARSDCSSCTASTPVLLARNARSFSRSASTRPGNLGPIVDLLVEIGGLERRVSNASWFDHGGLQNNVRNYSSFQARDASRPSTRPMDLASLRRSTIMGLREQRHGRLQACDISIHRRAARRPCRGRQGVRRCQADQAGRLCDRARHPGGLADRAWPD